MVWKVILSVSVDVGLPHIPMRFVEFTSLLYADLLFKPSGMPQYLFPVEFSL